MRIRRHKTPITSHDISMADNAMGVIQNFLDALYNIGVAFSKTTFAGDWIKRGLGWLNNPLVPTFFFLFSSVTLVITNGLNIFKLYREERLKNEPNFLIKYKNTLIQTGIFIGYMLALAASLATSILVSNLILQTSIVGIITLTMILMDIANEIREKHENSNRLKEIQNHVEQLKLKIQNETDVFNDLSTSDDNILLRSQCAKIQTNRLNIFFLNIELNKLLKEQEHLLKEDVYRHQYFITAILGLCALVFTCLPIFFPASIIPIAIMGSLALLCSLGAAALNIQRLNVSRINDIKMNEYHEDISDLTYEQIQESLEIQSQYNRTHLSKLMNQYQINLETLNDILLINEGYVGDSHITNHIIQARTNLETIGHQLTKHMNEEVETLCLDDLKAFIDATTLEINQIAEFMHDKASKLPEIDAMRSGSWRPIFQDSRAALNSNRNRFFIDPYPTDLAEDVQIIADPTHVDCHQ